MSVLVGIGLRLPWGLRIGGGVLALAALVGDIIIPSRRNRPDYDDFRRAAHRRLRPDLGARWAPSSERFQLGLTLPRCLTLVVSVAAAHRAGRRNSALGCRSSRLPELPSMIRSSLRRETTVRLTQNLQIIGQLAWKKWSDYRYPIEPATADSPPLPARLPRHHRAARCRRIPSADAAIHSADTPRWLFLRMDADASQPPDDDGKSLLDASRHVLTIGLGLSLTGKVPLDVDLFGQAHLLSARQSTFGSAVCDGATPGGAAMKRLLPAHHWPSCWSRAQRRQSRWTLLVMAHALPHSGPRMVPSLMTVQRTITTPPDLRDRRDCGSTWATKSRPLVRCRAKAAAPRYPRADAGRGLPDHLPACALRLASVCFARSTCDENPVLSFDQPRLHMYDNRTQRLYMAANLAIHIYRGLYVGVVCRLCRVVGNCVSARSRRDFGPRTKRADIVGGTRLVRDSLSAGGAAVGSLKAPDAGADLSAPLCARPRARLPNRAQVADPGQRPVVDKGTLKELARSVDLFQPWQLVGAGSAVFRLQVSFDLTFARFSEQPVPAAEFALDLDIGRLTDLVKLPKSKAYPSVGFHDLLIPAVGLEWRALDGVGPLSMDARAGYRYEASPVPIRWVKRARATPTNTSSASVSARSLGLTKVLPRPLNLDAYVGLTYLPSRLTQKADPRSAVGDFPSLGLWSRAV